jgi:hypothetical protein
METDPLAELLRAAGPRVGVPAERARRVEHAVRAEWQDVVKRRSARRRATLAAIAGLASAVAIALGFQTHVHPGAERTAAGPPVLVQTHPVAETPRPRYDGSYYRASGEDRMPDRGLPRHVLASYAWETR